MRHWRGETGTCVVPSRVVSEVCRASRNPTVAHVAVGTERLPPVGGSKEQLPPATAGRQWRWAAAGQLRPDEPSGECTQRGCTRGRQPVPLDWQLSALKDDRRGHVWEGKGGCAFAHRRARGGEGAREGTNRRQGRYPTRHARDQDSKAHPPPARRVAPRGRLLSDCRARREQPRALHAASRPAVSAPSRRSSRSRGTSTSSLSLSRVVNSLSSSSRTAGYRRRRRVTSSGRCGVPQSTPWRLLHTYTRSERRHRPPQRPSPAPHPPGALNPLDDRPTSASSSPTSGDPRGRCVPCARRVAPRPEAREHPD